MYLNSLLQYSKGSNMDLRATRAEISIKNFKNNLNFFKHKIENRPLCLAVKANSYGHGLIQMAKHAKDIVGFLAVSSVNEGVRLRESGITLPVFVMLAHIKSEIPIICKYNLTPFVSHGEFLEQYQECAEYHGIKLNIHIKVDTGMGRAGLMPKEVLDVAKKVLTYKNLNLEGLCTHFASADDNKLFTNKQISVFKSVIDELQQNNISPKYIHAANSWGIMHYPDSYFTLARVGIGAYGYVDNQNIKPVMSFKSKVTIEKIIPKGHGVSYGCTWVAKEDTKIGIVPVGYGDGYMRCLSGKSKVLIDGKLYPVLGRVCMDQIVVALPKDQNCLEKDVVLFGDHKELNAQTLAELSGTISYEILTSISDRVPRLYI